MLKLTQWRKTMATLLLIASFLAHLPDAPFEPAVALAAPSQDPDEEIVYIDASGFIRVLDTRVAGGNPQVQWFSPDGGWRDFALADVDGDGDMEIVAIGGGLYDGKLAVFDPVVASGAINPDQTINGIPWDTLYRVEVPGSPQLVAAGNFDENIPGDEIIFVYEMRPEDRPSNDLMRLVGLKSDSPTPNGRGWVEHFSGRYNERWNQIAVGNLDNRGTDEFALVAEDNNNMQVFRVDGGLRRIFNYGSDSRPPKAVAIGRWEGSNRPMLAWVRTADPPLPAMVVQRWSSDGDFSDVATEAFNPSPRVIFFAQINDNSDEEVVMLRNVPGNVRSPRMIVRGRRQSSIPSELEQRLDDDNGYRAGAAGDIDGDGKDEIVLIRDNRMLVFYEPDRSANSNTYDVTTNRRSVAIGDLDKNGFIFGPQFGLDRSKVDAVLEAGGAPKVEIVTLTNLTTQENIPFTAAVVGAPSWVTISPPTGVTPSQLFLTFNATGLQAGDYKAQVQIFSSNPAVINQPINIEVNLRVTAALVSLQPSSVSFSYPCTDTISIPTRRVNVGGTAGIRYTAAVVSSPELAAAQATLDGPIYSAYVDAAGALIVSDEQGNEAVVPTAGDVMAASQANTDWPSGVSWLAARSQTGVIPDTLTLQASTIYSETFRFDEALLVLVADSRAGAPPSNVRIMPVSNLCATTTLHLSMIGR